MSGISVSSRCNMGVLDMVQAYSFPSCYLVHFLYYVVHMTASRLLSRSEARCNIGVVDMVQAYILFIFELLFSTLVILCRLYESSMATTSVCSLPQHWDASQDAGIISCLSCSLKQLLYFTLCICQQRVFQVFFYIYLIFTIVHMTASRLLPVSTTYRNAQLMDSLLSYFSSKRHIVFSELVITVLYCHSTFILALTFIRID